MNNNLFSKTRYNIKSIVLTKFVNRREKERFFHYLCGRIINVMLFQDKLKELRVSHNLLQRQVAAGIDIDTAIYCKIEKGDRQAREEQVRRLALFYGVPFEELRRYWLVGKVYNIVEKESDVNGILHMVSEEMVEYSKPNNEK